jgi:hypothetical protein
MKILENYGDIDVYTVHMFLKYIHDSLPSVKISFLMA